jgi:hypothetical protein
LTNIGPGLVRTPEPTGGGGARGPVRPPGIPGDENRPVGAPPFAKPAPSGQITESEMNRPGVDPRVAPTQAGEGSGGGGWTNWIAPSILALFAAQMARRGGGAHVPPGTTPTVGNAIPAPVQPPLPRVPTLGPTSPAQGPLPTVPTLGPTSPVPQPGAPAPAAAAAAPPSPAAASARPPMAPGPGQTPADVARMQAEVDAENLRLQIKKRARSGGGGGRTTP